MQSYIPMGGEAASLNPEVISIQRAFIIKMKNKEKTHCIDCGIETTAWIDPLDGTYCMDCFKRSKEKQE